MRLDRLISKALQCGIRGARAQLVAGTVSVNGRETLEGDFKVDRFDRVLVGERVIQARVRRYVALHKPSGCVSATVDAEHPTVLDLIGTPWAEELHLAGRLDRFTTGLVILTNDSRFSEALTLPEGRVAKVYRVDTEAPIPAPAIAAFEKGMRFEKEKVTTAPAVFESLGECRCRLTIYEGKHHQVKRMFARFDVKVIALHRESIGGISLQTLPEGHWRSLTADEWGHFADRRARAGKADVARDSG